MPRLAEYSVANVLTSKVLSFPCSVFKLSKLSLTKAWLSIFIKSRGPHKGISENLLTNRHSASVNYAFICSRFSGGDWLFRTDSEILFRHWFSQTGNEHKTDPQSKDEEFRKRHAGMKIFVFGDNFLMTYCCSFFINRRRNFCRKLVFRDAWLRIRLAFSVSADSSWLDYSNLVDLAKARSFVRKKRLITLRLVSAWMIDQSLERRRQNWNLC